MRIDHVQIAIPPDVEERADRFYVELMGLTPMEKPASLARRGGRWYGCGDLQVHLGVDPQFVPSAKSHVAFRVSDYDGLERRLRGAAARVVHDDELPGVDRFYTWDPFGNRLEVVRG
jgi:catechol 2,3-dioxygenase-like lactoylglutathione lyase family enzyme